MSLLPLFNLEQSPCPLMIFRKLMRFLTWPPGECVESIGSAVRLTSTDVASVIAMFYKDAESAYTILEIDPSASNDEVKAAYRRMAMKNHPDKVATLGADVQKAAGEKFRKIQEAYETIKKERGMN